MPRRRKRKRWPKLSELIEKRGDCWIWIGRKDKNGYGWISRLGHSYSAHEYLYLCRFGSLPPGLVLDHECNNPSCVNPYHLTPKSAADNCRRGRNAKLTMEKANNIRAPRGGWPNSAKRGDRLWGDAARNATVYIVKHVHMAVVGESAVAHFNALPACGSIGRSPPRSAPPRWPGGGFGCRACWSSRLRRRRTPPLGRSRTPGRSVPPSRRRE
jgi:hypothetical protein